MNAANAPVTIAVTGGIGSGKSTLARLLGELGADVFSADAAVHELYRTPEVRKALVDRWGTGIINENDDVDRRAVASRVFTNPEELRWLESLLHPLVEQKWLRFLQASGANVVVAEVPLLFEKELNDRYDYCVLVTADKHIKEDRLADRGDSQDASARMAQQMDDSEKVGRADLVVDNSGSMADLQNHARIIMQELGRNA